MQVSKDKVFIQACISTDLNGTYCQGSTNGTVSIVAEHNSNIRQTKETGTKLVMGKLDSRANVI